jgi:hypothetical protein
MADIIARGLASRALQEKVSSTHINNILKLTQAEYDALVSAGTLDANTLYLIEE